MTARNALLEPITGEHICGQDCRYEDEFELIEQEIGKLNNLYHREEPDWQRVADHAQALLTTRTKDIRLACWLTRAWLCLDGSAGLVRGCALLVDLCSEFWSALYPLKSRARNAAFQGLFSVLDTQLDDTFLERQTPETLEQLNDALTGLEQALSPLLDDDTDGLAVLARRCQQQLKRQARTQAAPPSVQATPSAAKVEAPAPAPGIPNLDEPVLSAIASERDAAKLLRQLQDSARVLGSFWQRENPADARRFRLSRVLTWAAISALPGADANGRTQLKPVPTTKLHHYRDRLQQGDYAALLDELEISLTKAPFWLDGHHMSWQCLTGLRWQAAADEVAHQTRRFSEAFPSLLELCFDDGTPFAAPDTQDWLGTSQEVTSSAESVVLDDNADQWQIALNEAFSQLSQLGLATALQPLQVGAQQAPSQREATTWRLAMARICLQDKKFDVAVALLTPIFQQFEQHQLWLWDPALGREVCRLLLTGLDKLPQKHDRPALRQHVYERLCGLDAGLALEY